MSDASCWEAFCCGALARARSLDIDEGCPDKNVFHRHGRPGGWWRVGWFYAHDLLETRPPSRTPWILALRASAKELNDAT